MERVHGLKMDISVVGVLFALTLLTLSSSQTHPNLSLRDERISANVCITAGQWDPISDWDLCRNSTTDELSLLVDTDDSYYCSCDESCLVYGDCCLDAIHSRGVREGVDPVFDIKESQKHAYSCSRINLSNRSMFIYTVTSCAKDWGAEGPLHRIVEDKCVSSSSSLSPSNYMQTLPVFSESTKTLYRNVFCALCNHDEDDLFSWNVSLQCIRTTVNNGQFVPLTRRRREIIPSLMETLPVDQLLDPVNYDSQTQKWTFTVNESRFQCHIEVKEFNYQTLHFKFNARICRESINSCPAEWPRDDLREKCNSYTGYIYAADESTAYRNYHCALCNGANLSLVQCYYNPRFIGYPRTQSTTKKTLWYPLLLDFVPSREGDYVGGSRKGSCSLREGQYFDPLAEKCIDFSCGKLFEYDEEERKCIPKSNLIHTETKFENALFSECPKMLVTEFDSLDNGSIYVNSSSKVYKLHEYEFASDSNDSQDMVLICIEQDLLIASPTFSFYQVLVTEISLYISITCLVVHLIVYAVVPKLRNLPGKNLMSFSSSLLFSQIGFLSIGYVKANHKSFPCLFAAIVTHYSYLASFSWMNVMAIDVYRTFNSRSSTDKWAGNRNRSLFLKYSLFSWLTPALIVILATICDLSLEGSLFQPLYGYGICWINQKTALLTFFALPLALIICVNFVLFSLTASSLNKIKRETQMVRNESDRVRFVIYVKLALLMGFTWVFGFVAALTRYDILWYPFIVFNGLQGAFIFLFFTAKRKVLLQFYNRVKGNPESQSSQRTDTTTMNSRNSVKNYHVVATKSTFV